MPVHLVGVSINVLSFERTDGWMGTRGLTAGSLGISSRSIPSDSGDQDSSFQIRIKRASHGVFSLSLCLTLEVSSNTGLRRLYTSQHH